MWNDGYVSEVDYVHGYFGQLAPTWLRLALLSRRVAHAVSDVPTYLELGFGQGLSLVMHAAVNAGAFYGVDFNPAQVCNAQELAASSQRPVELFEQSFEEFARRDDLPDFDIIAMHGVWSWVSPATRDAILAIIGKRLRPGGVFYISYNTIPGWSAALPLRHLMHEYGRRGAKGRLLSRVDEAIGFAEEVMAAGARYFAENPGTAGRLAGIRQQDLHYVSHEYFNSNWQTMSFAEVADALALAKLDYAASANLIDNLDGISVPAAAIPVLDKIGDETLRQLTRDYFVNQSFRRDIFVKGARTMSRATHLAAIRKQRFWQVGETAPTSIETAAGTADLLAGVYNPVVDVFAANRDRAVSIDELTRNPACSALTVDQIWEAVLVLAGVNFLAPAADAADETSSRLLNAEIIERTAASNTTQYLAAPAIGAALHVDRLELMFLRAIATSVGDPVAYVEGELAFLGEYVADQGAAVTDPQRARELLTNRWKQFGAVKLPLLQRLGAV